MHRVAWGRRINALSVICALPHVAVLGQPQEAIVANFLAPGVRVVSGDKEAVAAVHDAIAADAVKVSGGAVSRICRQAPLSFLALFSTLSNRAPS